LLTGFGRRLAEQAGAHRDLAGHLGVARKEQVSVPVAPVQALEGHEEGFTRPVVGRCRWFDFDIRGDDVTRRSNTNAFAASDGVRALGLAVRVFLTPVDDLGCAIGGCKLIHRTCAEQGPN
jgi:hypothetical protein